MMKRYLVAIIVIALALASCTKELESDRINSDNTIEEVKTVLTFSSERPQLDPSTKTAWDAESHGIVWSAGDKIKIGFTFNSDWWAVSEPYASGNPSPNNNIKFYQSNEVAIDSDRPNIGTFTVPGSFSGPTTSGDFDFYAVYPSSLVTSNNQKNAPNVPISLKSYQIPQADSFDATTDILVAKSNTITTSEPGFPTETINLYWTRVVAHGNFTLKNFQDVDGFDDGETITKVVFTAQESARLTGDYILSVADGNCSGSDTYNEVILDGTHLSFVQDESGNTNLNVWLSVMPETLEALDVVVETNKATYSKSWTGITKQLKGNCRNTMGINMGSATREPKEVVYSWVRRDFSSITPNDVFVIVGNNGSTYAMSNANDARQGGPSAVSVSVSASGDRLINEPATRLQWTLSKDGENYTFYPNGSTSTWLYCTNSTGNVVRIGTGSNNIFTMGRSGYLKNTVNNTARYLGIYNSTDWRCYERNGWNMNSNIRNQSFAFYVRIIEDEELLTPSINFTPSAITVNVGESVSNTVSIEPSGLPVTYSSSNPSVATVDPSTGEVTGVARGNANITAVFDGNASYNAVSTTCSVSVVDPSRPYTITFAEGKFSDYTNSYTGSFDYTYDGLDLTLANVNNGTESSNWTEMRAGRRNYTSVATITTKAAIPEAIKTVTLSITSSSYVNSITLIVSPNSDFSSPVGSYSFSGTGVGDVSATVTNPAANMYYKISIDLANPTNPSGVGNGFFRFDKIVYSIE